MSRPRFTLLAILGCTTTLSVLLALIAARSIYGWLYLPLAVAACIGYLVRGWTGFWVSVVVIAIGMFLAAGVYAVYLAFTTL